MSEETKDIIAFVALGCLTIFLLGLVVFALSLVFGWYSFLIVFGMICVTLLLGWSLQRLVERELRN